MNRYLQDEFYEARDIPPFKLVLKKWIAVQRKYAQQTKNDYSWNHSERASTGFLAVAAWNAGGVALEEWHANKGPLKKPRKGRCDIYIDFRKQRFHIEAKHMWSRATGKWEKERIYIERRLNAAVADAKDLQCLSHEKMAVLFIAPFYPAGKQAEMSSHIATWLEGIYSIPHSAIAWLFLERHKLRRHRTKNVLPGIVIIVRSLNHSAL